MIQPFISLVVLCRNEKQFIGKCLDSILANDYPQDKMEILVADGMSHDGTREILSVYKQHHFCIQIIDNPGLIAPKAMNLGIKSSQGELIFIMGAHTSYSPNYISLCVDALLSRKADCAGGRMILSPRQKTATAQAIILAITSRFGSGGARYKTGQSKSCHEVDTVPYGVYRKEVFERIGLYDERLAKSLDTDFNLRLRKAGGKILLVPEAVATYYVRSRFRDIVKYYYVNGVWIFYPLRFGIRAFEIRHLVPFIFVSSLLFFSFFAMLHKVFGVVAIAVATLYLGTMTAVALQHARSVKNVRLFPLIALAYCCTHIPAGFGTIIGGIKACTKTLASKLGHAEGCS